MTAGHFPASSPSYRDYNSFTIVYNLPQLLAAGENAPKPGSIVNKGKRGEGNIILTTGSQTTHFTGQSSEPTASMPATHPGFDVG